MAIAAYFRLYIAARGTTDVPGPTLDACGARTRRIMTKTRCLATAVELVPVSYTHLTLPTKLEV